MQDSEFRCMLEHLRQLKGRRIEWPQILRLQIAQEFKRIRQSAEAYGGKQVFIGRDSEAIKWANHKNPKDERVAVYRLYREVHQQKQGCIFLGDEKVWLVSAQVPNQGKKRGRRADLVGIRLDGSMVVFECKTKGNEKDTPLSGLFEGLDYLAHLVAPSNLERFNEGLRVWSHKPRVSSSLSVVPSEFADVIVRSDVRHAVFVLAPQVYYDYHMLDAKKVSQEWHLLSDRHWPNNTMGVQLDFALTEYDAGPTKLLEL